MAKRAVDHDEEDPNRKIKKRRRDGADQGRLEDTASRHVASRQERSEIDERFSHIDGQLLSDLLAQKAKRFERRLTEVELDDKFIPEIAWLDSSSWEQPRHLENLGKFLDRFCRKSDRSAPLAWAPEGPGAPHTIMLTGAALRAANLVRVLRIFKTKEAGIAKLFAKHIKLKEAEEYVRSSRIGLAVGTPTRVLDLVKTGALSVGQLERVVIDGSHLDAKQRNIFDMRETCIPLLEFLNLPELKDRYRISENKVDLLVY